MRKPQEKKAALPLAPSYSLDPEERRQRSKRDIVEGRKKKDEPAGKVERPVTLLMLVHCSDNWPLCVHVVFIVTRNKERREPRRERRRLWRTTCNSITYLSI